MWKGIDVSDNQGVIAWEQVKAAGCQFAVLRSIRRSGKADNQFEANLKGCINANIPVSVYKYTYAVSPEAAVIEAKQVVELLKKYNLNTIVWWDVEDRDTLAGIGSAKLTASVKAAEKTVTEAGYKFGIYTGLYVYKESWFDFGQFSCPLWVARYPSSSVKTLDTSPDEKFRPDVGRAIWGWQYSSNGSVPGISTKVDIDLCYKDPKEYFTNIPSKNQNQYVVTIENINYAAVQEIQKKLSEIMLEGVVYQKVI